MNKTLQQLTQQCASCPTTQKEYEINGKKYKVIRHFTGEKDINKEVAALAVNRADREFGIT